MKAKESFATELVKECRDMPPEVLKTLMELVRTVKQGLEAERAKAQAERVIKRYQKRAASFDFSLAPDADYAEELIEAYRSTFPRGSVE